MYGVPREMDVRLSTSNDYKLPTLNIDIKKREKRKFVIAPEAQEKGAPVIKVQRNKV